MKIQDRIKEFVRVPASQLNPNPKNWRSHPPEQQRAIQGILEEVGYADALIAYETDQGLTLIDGHLRANTTPDDTVPVLVLDVNEEEADKILATLDPLAAMAGRDDLALTGLLDSITATNNEVGHLLDQMQFDLTVSSLDDARESLKKPHDTQSRTVPFDMYITGMKTPYCCLAVTAGLKYGIRSTETDGRRKAPTACEPFFNKRHQLQFIDNEFHKYDHKFHIDYVEQYRPKMATVRDIMTESQCSEAGIEFYGFNQVIEFADEMAEYAEQVIVIPKYDCLDDIPERFVLGYSVPTRYGGTALPIEAFKGRSVHLLGGSWKQQRSALQILGDDVISADNNQIQLLANVGSYYKADGEVGHLSTPADGINLGSVTNPGMIAFAVSAGAMAAGLKELMGQPIETESEEE